MELPIINNKFKFKTVVLCLAIFFSLSPIVCDFVGVKGNIIFIFLCFLSFSVGVDARLSKRLLLLCVFLVINSVLLALFWQVPKFSFLSIYLIVSMFAAIFIYKNTLHLFTQCASLIVFVMAILAWIGFFYALWGGSYIYETINPDGRRSFLFLSTMTNFMVGNFIRPSGFFDEPGAFSFVICMIIFLRDALKMNRLFSLCLLFLGLVTFSIAHILFTVLFFLLSTSFSLRWKICSLLIILLFSIVVYNLDFDVINRFILSRFEMSDGGLSGDNRSSLFFNALSLAGENSLVWLFGLDSICMIDVYRCSQMYPPFGENPLSPAVTFGLLNTVLYYISILALVFFTFTKRLDRSAGIMNVSIAVLLLQRPYLMAYGYSLIICIVLCVAVFGVSKIKIQECVE